MNLDIELNSGGSNKFGSGLQPYDENGDAKDKTNTTGQFVEFFYDFLYKDLKKFELAVDVGCGNGRISYAMASIFSFVIGIDKSNYLDDRFVSSNIKYYLNSSFVDIGFGKKVDFILFLGSFYLMENYLNTFIKCYDILDENGLILIIDGKDRNADKADVVAFDFCYSIKKLCEHSQLIEVKDYLLQNKWRGTVLKKYAF